MMMLQNADGKPKSLRLWVDDIRTPPDDTWHIARTIGAAVRALDAFKDGITEINIDHDISHQVSLGAMSRPYPCEETFETVARYVALLKEQDANWNPIIHIRTSNPAGALRMKQILEDSGLLPDVEFPKGANRLETIL